MNMPIFIFCIFYFTLAIKRLDWAVMLLIAALPFYLIRFNIFGVPFTILETMILVSFGVWIFKNYREIIDNLKIKFQIPNSKFQIPNLRDYPFKNEIVLMLIISFISAGIAGFSDSALGIWKAYFFEPALLFILVFNMFGEADAEKSSQPPPTLPTGQAGTFVKGGINKILWPLAVSALAVSVFSIYQKFTGAFIPNEFWAAEETRRVTSFFGYPNAVGLFLGPIVLILTGFLLNQIRDVKNKIFNFQFSTLPAGRQVFKQFSIFNPACRQAGFQTIIIFLTIILSLMAIYFAKSEGALVGIIAGLFVFGILKNKKSRRVAVGITILLTVGILSFAQTREYAINKILLRDLSGQIRKAQWAETWEMLNDGRLVFGAGLANYQNAIKPYHKEGIFVRDYSDPDWHRKTVWNEEFRASVWQPTEIYLYPHNIFLNFWVELGLAGMLLFIWIFVKFFYIGLKLIPSSKFPVPNSQIFQNNKFIILGLIGALIVILVHGLVDVPYFKNDLAAMFWIFAAILGLINLGAKNNNFTK